MALHHFPWLSITSPGFLSHHLASPHCIFHALLLFFYTTAHPQAGPAPQPTPQPLRLLQPGLSRARGAPWPPPPALLMAPFWAMASLTPGLQPPQGATSCPNPPSCGASTLWRCPTALCPSPPHFGALWISLILAHGEPRPNAGLLGALEGPWRVAVETCRNRVGSARAWLGRSGAGSYREAVGER